jgi:hypothetical protein
MKTTKLIALSMAVCFGATSAFAVPPSNDDCTSADKLEIGCQGSPFTKGTNINATLEPTAYDTITASCWAAGGDADATVWYWFEVTKTSSYTISTEAADGSGPDTQLQLFSAPNMNCDSLNAIGCSEDDGRCDPANSLAAEIREINLDAGKYYVQVDIYGVTQADFGIGVVDEDAAPDNDCVLNPDSIDHHLDAIDEDNPFHCVTYCYSNVSMELFNGGAYMDCNNDPGVGEFFGVWFDFEYDGSDAWVSVNALESEQCDFGVSGNIFYTMHLFEGQPSATCGSPGITGLASLGCSVGDDIYTESDLIDQAGNDFYDHPRIDLSGLVVGTTYHLMVAQMTRYTVDVVTQSEPARGPNGQVLFTPLGDTIFIETVVEERTIADPDNGKFDLVFEAIPSGTKTIDGRSSDKCSTAFALTDEVTESGLTNAGTTGNILISYHTTQGIADEPDNYTGDNGGRGYSEDCSDTNSVFVGGSLSWENHNSAIYSFEIEAPLFDTLICFPIETVKNDIITLIDILCPAAFFYPNALPPVFDLFGDTLLDPGAQIALLLGDTISIPDTSVCNQIKTIVLNLFNNPALPDSLCVEVNCSPGVTICMNNIERCGNGSPLIMVMKDDCETGPVVHWGAIDEGLTSFSLNSALQPYEEGTYYVIVEGDGAVLSYDLTFDKTFRLGAGGIECEPHDIAPSASSSASVATSIGEKEMLNGQFDINYLVPVPATNELTVGYVLANDANNVSISIMDMTGKEVVAQQVLPAVQGQNRHTLDVSGLNAGIYFLSIEKDGHRVVSRFTKAD